MLAPAGLLSSPHQRPVATQSGPLGSPRKSGRCYVDRGWPRARGRGGIHGSDAMCNTCTFSYCRHLTDPTPLRGQQGSYHPLLQVRRLRLWARRQECVRSAGTKASSEEGQHSPHVWGAIQAQEALSERRTPRGFSHRISTALRTVHPGRIHGSGKLLVPFCFCSGHL